MNYKKARKDFTIRQHKSNVAITVLLMKTLRNNTNLMTYKNYPFFLNSFYYTRALTPKNHCFLTGKNRGVVSKYRLVRHEYKRLANAGLLYGVSKTSF